MRPPSGEMARGRQSCAVGRLRPAEKANRAAAVAIAKEAYLPDRTGPIRSHFERRQIRMQLLLLNKLS